MNGTKLKCYTRRTKTNKQYVKCDKQPVIAPKGSPAPQLKCYTRRTKKNRKYVTCEGKKK